MFNFSLSAKELEVKLASGGAGGASSDESNALKQKLVDAEHKTAVCVHE